MGYVSAHPIGQAWTLAWRGGWGESRELAAALGREPPLWPGRADETGRPLGNTSPGSETEEWEWTWDNKIWGMIGTPAGIHVDGYYTVTTSWGAPERNTQHAGAQRWPLLLRGSGQGLAALRASVSPL